ncbi:hypothetical protein LTR29_016568 [Friedmanniomyces endolithicus]|nr:hypothetical protein LTR29_016568 [Friedmanniomyces endolithicus]
MATAAVSALMVDLTAPATYYVRLGGSIVKAGDSARSWASVRYNHKPALVDTEQAARSIRSTGKRDASELLLKDGGKEYGYAGDSTRTEHRYVLLLRGDGEDKEAVLEELNWSHAFNLTSTSEEKDAGKLKERYPYLTPEHDADDASWRNDTDSTAESPADPSNPFDYRHFLKAAAAAAAAKTKRLDLGAARSGTATPTVNSRAASSTPLARPIKRVAGSALVQEQKKRRAPASTAAADRAANPKRVKTGEERTSTASQRASAPSISKATESAPPPRIRVDRKASVRRPSYDDDSGELILENDDTTSAKLSSGRRAMAMALNGQLGKGPISLRSAASSPGSYLASPALGRAVDMEDDGDGIETGVADSSSPEETITRTGEPGYLDNDDDEDADADADVEDLELPSPATVHKPSVSATTITGGGEEDDLDAQLAAAMAEEEGVPAGAGLVLEEEEESEEE